MVSWLVFLLALHWLWLVWWIRLSRSALKTSECVAVPFGYHVWYKPFFFCLFTLNRHVDHIGDIYIYGDR